MDQIAKKFFFSRAQDGAAFATENMKWTQFRESYLSPLLKPKIGHNELRLATT